MAAQLHVPMCSAVRGCVAAALHERLLCFMPLICLWDKADEMLLHVELPDLLPAASLFILSLDRFFLIKEAVLLVRHSQPQPHHGRFDAFVLHSRMLTFSEWRMAEQLLSRKSII